MGHVLVYALVYNNAGLHIKLTLPIHWTICCSLSVYEIDVKCHLIAEHEVIFDM